MQHPRSFDNASKARSPVTGASSVRGLENALQNDKHCANLNVGLCDGSCYNVFALIRRSIFFTPEVLLVIILISSPLTQLVAVWGMTNERTLQLMKSRGHQTAVAMRDNLLTGEA